MPVEVALRWYAGRLVIWDWFIEAVNDADCRILCSSSLICHENRAGLQRPVKADFTAGISRRASISPRVGVSLMNYSGRPLI
jgi:hypothetical protein